VKQIWEHLIEQPTFCVDPNNLSKLAGWIDIRESRPSDGGYFWGAWLGLQRTFMLRKHPHPNVNHFFLCTYEQDAIGDWQFIEKTSFGSPFQYWKPIQGHCVIVQVLTTNRGDQ